MRVTTKLVLSGVVYYAFVITAVTAGAWGVSCLF